MKKFSMLMVWILVLCLLTSVCATLVGCDGFGDVEGEEQEDVDPTRTQLRIGNYYGGLGDAWLQELKRQYELLHPDVQILITNDKPSFVPDTLKASIKTDKHQIYVAEKQYYYDLVNDGKIADITDIVTEPLTKYGETMSIADKFEDEGLKEYYGGANTNNKYYALPTYMSHCGIIYDVDLWEAKGFYIADGSTDTSVQYTTGLAGAKEKSAGPDGVKGTRDDGMPATYAQFQQLVKTIRSRNCTPFIWSGGISVYQQMISTAWWVDYEGYDNFSLNYTLDGSYTFDGDTAPTKIDASNAYLLQKQSGKKYALQFVSDIFKNDDNYTRSSGGTTNDHLGAQYEYLISSPSGTSPVAMFLESDWWENEANKFTTGFGDMVNIYGEQWAYGNRRFAYMPIPKTDGSAEGETVLSTSSTCCTFINANAGDTLELAKDFLQFMHTESSLQVFNTYTGMCRPYKYTLTSEQYNKLTYFSQYLYDMYKGDNAVKVVHDVSLCSKRNANMTYFRDEWEWSTSLGSKLYNNPFKVFSTQATISVNDYFSGMLNYQQNKWSTLK